ncbi:hypothetical protein SAMN05421676_10770 [Salinibacillus kushneri]|uniref:Type IV pilus assembly protein PilN n=1 Tax=Salinibacillus kushneri TaxID=237682 RepID=A0A1I0GPN1_9BACI|nr:PilN domain-containing protein [Salinibacillus kushneri]SET72121.1 hypothetical protein SAMN05421676_10770 [Salinibacillus kushneri]
MVVEINLLQNREQKNRTFMVTLIFMIFLLIVLFAAAFMYSVFIKQDISNLQDTLTQTEETRLNLTNQVNQEHLKEIDELKQAVKALQSYPIDSAAFITSLIALLPANAQIGHFEYTDGKINLQILMEDDMDAAYYLSHLSQTDWIDSVSLVSVSQTDQDENTQKYIAQYDLTINRDDVRENGEGDQE